MATIVLAAIAPDARADDAAPSSRPPTVSPAFRSVNGAVACTMTTTNYRMTEFTCFRARDGHYVRFSATDLMDDIRPVVTTGIDPTYVGASDPASTTARIGGRWGSSDAELIACRVRRDGVRCRHWRGPWFFIGYETGERTATH